MRYEKGHKEATRQRILEAASMRFRKEGIEAVGVISLMSDIGLTQGGFYNHFQSKEDLVREALADGTESSRAWLEGVKASAPHDELKALVNRYLSSAHRDNPGAGCVAAALSAEVARRSSETRAVFSEGLEQMVEMIRIVLPKSMKPKQRRSTALAIYSSMSGTLALARAVDDQALSEELLAAGRKAALALASVVE
jgi:TetR/AcrR family transcriptional regulator, transcriptional repressor for nem operon